MPLILCLDKQKYICKLNIICFASTTFLRSHIFHLVSSFYNIELHNRKTDKYWLIKGEKVTE